MVVRSGYKGRDRDSLLEEETTTRPIAVATHSAAAIMVFAMLVDLFLAFIGWRAPTLITGPGFFFRLFAGSAVVILAVFLIDRIKRP